MVLANTTLGVLMSSINNTILVISLPTIFAGLKVDPIGGGQAGLLLWMMLGYTALTTLCLLTIGRIGDLHRRVRVYNLGFVRCSTSRCSGSGLPGREPRLAALGAHARRAELHAGDLAAGRLAAAARSLLRVDPAAGGPRHAPADGGAGAPGSTRRLLGDRYGARVLASVGLLVQAGGFVLLGALPSDFSLPAFAFDLFVIGAGMCLFSAPNASQVMSSVPAEHRGVAAGARGIMTNTGMPASMALFFTLVITGFRRRCPARSRPA
jgi:MFS family permease